MPQAIVAGLAKIGAAIVSAVGTVGVYSTATLATIGATTVAVGAAIINSAMRGLMPDIEMPQSDTDRTRQQTVRGTIEPQKIVGGA